MRWMQIAVVTDCLGTSSHAESIDAREEFVADAGCMRRLQNRKNNLVFLFHRVLNGALDYDTNGNGVATSCSGWRVMTLWDKRLCWFRA